MVIQWQITSLSLWTVCGACLCFESALPFSHVSLRHAGSRMLRYTSTPPIHASGFYKAQFAERLALDYATWSTFTHIMPMPLQCSIDRARVQPHCCCCSAVLVLLARDHLSRRVLSIDKVWWCSEPIIIAPILPHLFSFTGEKRCRAAGSHVCTDSKIVYKIEQWCVWYVWGGETNIRNNYREIKYKNLFVGINCNPTSVTCH